MSNGEQKPEDPKLLEIFEISTGLGVQDIHLSEKGMFSIFHKSAQLMSYL